MPMAYLQHNTTIMIYTEIAFTIEPQNQVVNEVLTALCSELGCDSFNDSETGMNAYMPETDFNKEALDTMLTTISFDEKISYVINSIAAKNWNEEWEKNYFQPINVDNRCVIHSTFHTDYPETEYEIIIDPKMAFGTGHHATTSQMVGAILDGDFKGKSVLDMGCGTGVLAMLASMRGASPILAIDIDVWSYDNTLENMRINKIDNIDVKCGDASLLTEGAFDVVLANINRNILLNDMHAYVARLNADGHLIMSGFYSEDLDMIKDKAAELGLTYEYHKIKDNWTVVSFHKA